jgi:cytochrome c-type biogenesis protein CcmH
MIKRNFLLLTFFSMVLLTALLPGGAALAQQPTPSDDEVNAIARQLYCPVCENTPLDVCPTTACHQWRELIRQMLAEGKSEAEIKQYFVDYYGARVLSEPPAKGLYWLFPIIPWVAFFAGGLLLILAFITWMRSPKLSGGSNQTPSSKASSTLPKGTDKTEDEQYITRIENELKKRK